MIEAVTAAVPIPLRTAVDASLAWYDALCGLHGVPCGIRDDVWAAYAPPPPLHSAAKSVEPTVRPDRVLAAVEGLEQGGIADSFGSFDLTAEGFELLFEAQWIHRPASQDRSGLPPGWSVVRSAAELQRWTSHHDTQQVLLPGLLDRSSFLVLSRRGVDDADITGGVVLHLGTAAVSVSNLWADEPDQVWAEVVSAAAALFPGRALVGYEYGTDLERAQSVGFAAIGPQRVWVR
jgi:hypothetical protein